MTEVSKRIVIVAYEFYPVNNGGSHRPFRMASYLLDQGYNPIVITVDDKDQLGLYDGSLEKRLNRTGIEVIRTPIKPPNLYTRISTSYYINIVDDTFNRWKPYLIDELNTLTRDGVRDIIITVPPFSLAYLGLILKKKYSSVRIIMDMRDAWANWNIAPYASWLHYYMTSRLERKVFEAAIYILGTSKVTIEDFQSDHPHVDPSKFLFIPNSFDRYRDLESKKNKRIKIGYVGSFYYEPSREFLLTASWYQKKPHQWLQFLPHREQWIYRSPYFFFKILDGFFSQYPGFKESIEIVFAGMQPAWLKPMIDECNLQGCVRHVGKLNKQDVEDFERSVDYLLITSAKRHGRKDYSIAGKTYEYMSLRKPIIACVAEGAQKDLLEPTGLAVVLDPDKLEESIDVLKQLVTRGPEVSMDESYCNQFLTSNALAPLLKVLND